MDISDDCVVSRWETGVRFPNPVNLFRLAILYRTMADALYIDLIRVLRTELFAKRGKRNGKVAACETPQNTRHP